MEGVKFNLTDLQTNKSKIYQIKIQAADNGVIVTTSANQFSMPNPGEAEKKFVYNGTPAECAEKINNDFGMNLLVVAEPITVPGGTN